MAAPARLPLSPTLESVDAALARWRVRLAAASRNVSELSELPEFGGAKAVASGTGRLAREARALVATMDELWQGVLLIGATLDRAEQARRGGSRLWRGDEAAAEASAILDGASISVDLAETPVLHRTLLAGPRATAVVSPDALLTTMQAAFVSARDQLVRIGQASAGVAALEQELGIATAALPAPFAARLAAIRETDPLDRLEALEALRPGIAAATQLQAELVAADAALEALQRRGGAADAVAELAGWLGRLVQTFGKGGVDAARIGLGNWRGLHDVAGAAVARRDELQARFALLKVKARSRGALGLSGLEAGVEAAFGTEPVDLEAAAVALRAFQAALARGS